MLPGFELVSDGQNAFELTGLGRGGQQIQKCKDTYQKAVQILVELASLQVLSKAKSDCLCYSRRSHQNDQQKSECY
jgi:vacuolar-type H+-ATPase subunit D/Vma8